MTAGDVIRDFPGVDRDAPPDDLTEWEFASLGLVWRRVGGREWTDSDMLDLDRARRFARARFLEQGVAAAAPRDAELISSSAVAAELDRFLRGGP